MDISLQIFIVINSIKNVDHRFNRTDNRGFGYDLDMKTTNFDYDFDF